MKTKNLVQKFRSKVGGALAIGAAAMLPTIASAQLVIDTSGAVADIGIAKTAAIAIGSAVLGLAIAIMALKWVRRAM